MRRTAVIAVAVAVMVAVAVAVVGGRRTPRHHPTPRPPTTTTTTTATPTPTPTTTTTSTTGPAVGCRYDGQGITAGPDRRAGCTPGQWIADPDVSRAHVCSPAYNPRPGVDTSGALKDEADRLYGLSTASNPTVEADHLYPRWLGGATALANIWPEPNYPGGGRGFEHNPKDRLEFAVYRLVCQAAAMTPAQARVVFEGDWRAAYGRYVGRLP